MAKYSLVMTLTPYAESFAVGKPQTYCMDSTLQRLRAVCAATARLLWYRLTQKFASHRAQLGRKFTRTSRTATWANVACYSVFETGRMTGMVLHALTSMIDRVTLQETMANWPCQLYQPSHRWRATLTAPREQNNYNQTDNDGVAHFKNPTKCAYHVTFDLDLDLEHILDAGSPDDHRVQVW